MPLMDKMDIYLGSKSKTDMDIHIGSKRAKKVVYILLALFLFVASVFLFKLTLH